MTAIAPVITIDGPSGAGKGTLCKAKAAALQWHLLGSDANIRVLALAAVHSHGTAGIPSGCTFCVNQWQSGSDPRRGRCQR